MKLLSGRGSQTLLASRRYWPKFCLSGLMSLGRLRSGLVAMMLGLFALLTTTNAVAMKKLSDAQLGQIEGQQGVLISFDYYYNSQYTGKQIVDNSASGGSANFNINGRPLSGFCGNFGTIDSSTNCRLTWQLNGHDGGSGDFGGMTNAKGEWLVFKNGYLSMSVNRISLDGAFLGGATSTGSSYESFFDPLRFQNGSGGCLLPDGAGGKACTTANIKLMPALRTSYPKKGDAGSPTGKETSGSYEPATNISTDFADVRFGLGISGMAVEYGPNGYLATSTTTPAAHGSFVALKMADVNANQAGINFGGSFYMYGF